jgi:short-subunit dehydrogenase
MAGQPVTLITGASAGIGAALARVFAEHGHPLLLIANRSAQLEAVADHIAATGASRPNVLSLDLLRANATAHVEHELRHRGLEAQYVVNNAGFGLLGQAAELDRAQQLSMIDLNMRVLTDLSLRFIDSLERHRGGILNVASVLGFLPGPGMAVYHATKAYVISFSEALHRELAPRGVRVTALCPGPVDTDFSVRADGILSRRLTRSVERVARDGYAGLMEGCRLVVPGRTNKLLSVLPRLLPRHYVLSMVAASKRRLHRVDSG